MDDNRKGFISASALEAASDCQDKWNAERDIPSGESSRDATRGTRIHSVLAGFPLPLNEDDLQLYYQLANKRKWLVNVHFPDGLDREFKEQRLYLRDKKIGDHRFSGMPDFVGERAGKFLLIDYKTGRGEVAESPDNLQLRALAVLLAETYKADVVYAAIIQAYESPQVVAYSKADLKAARAEVVAILAASVAPNPERTATERACRYCRARPTCPEAKAKFNAIATIPNPAEITVAELPALLDAAKTAEKIIKDIRARAHAALSDGEAVEGWTLGNGRKTRTINNPAALRAELIGQGFASAADLDSIPMSPREIERAVASTTGVSAKAAQMVIERELGHFIDTTEGKPILKKI